MSSHATRALLSAAFVLSSALATLPAPAAHAARKPRSAPLGLRIGFASVDWLAPRDSAASQLGARGYRVSRAAAEGAKLVLEGALFDHVAVVRGWFDERDRLVRWVVTVADSGRRGYPEMRKVYDDIVAESETKYGLRDTWADRFVFPFEKGDTHEADALREGKATVRSVWRDREGDRLIVQMSPHDDVVLTYECPGWDDLQTRMRKRQARDL